MKFAKIRDVKSPARANPGDAGIDFFVPKFDDQFCEDFESKNPDQKVWLQKPKKQIRLAAQARVLIPSGVKVEVPHGYALIAFNKSGVSIKKGLDVGATVVDHGYQGEVHLSFTNASDTDVYINEGDKIVQFILTAISLENMEELSVEELFPESTARGDGGFGSTGTS